jgi:hypothetical protein
MKRNSAWCAVLVFLFAIGISAQTSFAHVLDPGTLTWTLTASQGATRTGTQALRGGGRSSYSIAQVVPIAANLNLAFAGGPPTTLARGHLVNGASP